MWHVIFLKQNQNQKLIRSDFQYLTMYKNSEKNQPYLIRQIHLFGTIIMLKSFHEMSKKTKLSKINKVTHPFSLQINLLTFLESL